MERNIIPESIGKRIFHYSSGVFMKTIFISYVMLFSICISSSYAQADYTDPEVVAQSFLDLCIEGERIVAAEKYATDESMSQIEVLIKQMVMNGKPLKNEHCKYFC